MDLLHTRNRERRFFSLCLQTGQRFVVNNKNPSVEERRQYTETALEANFCLTAYYFEISMAEAFRRNAARTGKERILKKEIGGTRKRLQIPQLEEGLCQIYKVQLHSNN